MAQTALVTFLRSGPAADRQDIDDTALVACCYVFGDVAGLKVGSPKRAWETAVLRAHGYVPEWTRTASSREALERHSTPSTCTFTI